MVGDLYNEVFHDPPLAAQLPDRIKAMCDFANGRSPGTFIHPVIRSIILHFWLAYDHPFVDGNGRTARALFYWSVLNHGYWLFEFISISQIIRKAPAKGADIQILTCGKWIGGLSPNYSCTGDYSMTVSILSDVIGPVMRGPSGSHCAAALRIGRLARESMDSQLGDVLVEFDSKWSFSSPEC